MDLHDHVSCDACAAQNFRGKRYKCLRCSDYDLCESCFARGATSGEHVMAHAMQCILTTSGFDILAELMASTNSREQNCEIHDDDTFCAISFTCPYCAEMGFSVHFFVEHLRNNHENNNDIVICPLCAAKRATHQVVDLRGHIISDHMIANDDVENGGGARSAAGAVRTRGVRSRRTRQLARRSIPRGLTNNNNNGNNGGNAGGGGGGGPASQSVSSVLATLRNNVRMRHTAGGGGLINPLAAAAANAVSGFTPATASDFAALQDIVRPRGTTSNEQLQRFQGLLRELERDNGLLVNAASNGWSGDQQASLAWPSLFDSSALAAIASGDGDILLSRSAAVSNGAAAAAASGVPVRTAAEAVDVPDALGGNITTQRSVMNRANAGTGISMPFDIAAESAANDNPWAVVNAAGGEITDALTPDKRTEAGSGNITERLSLLARLLNDEEREAEQGFSQHELANRVLFVQQLLITALRDGVSFADDDDDDNDNGGDNNFAENSC